MLRVLAASLLLQSVAAQTPPNFGAACSISSCSCAGFCLSSEKGKVVDTPPDDEGYAFKFSLCAVIPDDEMPSGCKDLSQDATVVRYKIDNTDDCMQLGEISNMFAKPTERGGLNITYTYAYGCTNSFTAMVTPSPSGSKPLPPGTVTYTDCDYSMRWVTAAQKTATCTPPVIPPTACESALSRLCSGAKRAGKGNCFICTGQHQQDFLQAHCAQHDFDHFCS